jgi:hypothetical protein
MQWTQGLWDVFSFRKCVHWQSRSGSVRGRVHSILPSVYTYPDWFDWVEGTDGKTATSLLLPPRSPGFDMARVRPRAGREALVELRGRALAHPCVALLWAKPNRVG